jgi:SAM-dependent methyltransferase
VPTYSPAAVARYFDDFGDREWNRLIESPSAEIKLHVHSHYLRRFVAPGARVLDIGAGAGRFTQILGSLGASVVVADISPRQLELNQRYAEELGFRDAVSEWRLADICDLSSFASDTFDAVVCYGGPLSYVFEQGGRAVKELGRVVKPGGRLLLSVMTLWGAIHEHLLGVLEVDSTANARIVETGDLLLGPNDGSRHHCHLFRVEELRELLATLHDFDVVALSASNAVSTVWGDRLKGVRDSPARWAELLAFEIEACSQAGALELGSHLIAVVERRAT